MGPINVHDYERLARERLSPAAWAYYSSGADDEVTLREERAAFERLRFLLRVLRGGAAGVRDVLGLLREELELAMVLAGATGVEGIGPNLLWEG